MADFTRTTNRDQRPTVYSRQANPNTYTINWRSVDTKSQTHNTHIIPFQKSGGHVTNAANGLDLHYNDLDAFHRLHNGLYTRGSVKFDKMGAPNHTNAHKDLRFPSAETNGATSSSPAGGGRYAYTGDPFTTHRIADIQIKTKYERELGTTKNTVWDRMLSREDRDKSKDKAKALYSSTRMCGLQVSYAAVDIDADHVVRFDPDGRHFLQREKRLHELRARAKIQRDIEKRKAVLAEEEEKAAAAHGAHSGVVGSNVDGADQTDSILFKRSAQRTTAFLRPSTSTFIQGLDVASAAAVADEMEDNKKTILKEYHLIKGNQPTNTSNTVDRVDGQKSNPSPAPSAENLQAGSNSQPSPPNLNTVYHSMGTSLPSHLQKDINSFNPYTEQYPNQSAFILGRKRAGSAEGSEQQTATASSARPRTAGATPGGSATTLRPALPNRPQSASNSRLPHPPTSSALPANGPISYDAVGDPINAFNQCHRVLARNLSFNKAQRFVTTTRYSK